MSTNTNDVGNNKTVAAIVQQGPKSTNTVASSNSNAISSAASASNKFLPVNINSQFKGKSIEPQQKTNGNFIF
jgi:hypothetical protein